MVSKGTQLTERRSWNPGLCRVFVELELVLLMFADQDQDILQCLSGEICFGLCAQ